MFGAVADLVRGMGLPWSGAAYLAIVAIVLFVMLKIVLYVLLYVSYLFVSSLRRANVPLPALIYTAESAMYNVRRRLRGALWICFIVVAGWAALYLGRASLEGDHIVALEHRMTSVVESLISAN